MSKGAWKDLTSFAIPLPPAVQPVSATCTCVFAVRGGDVIDTKPQKRRYIPSHWPTIIPYHSSPRDCTMSSGRSLRPVCHPLMSQYLLPWTTKVPNYAERVSKKQEILILWGWIRRRQIWRKQAEFATIKFGEILLFVFPSSSYGAPLRRWPDVPARITAPTSISGPYISEIWTAKLQHRVMLGMCITDVEAQDPQVIRA